MDRDNRLTLNGKVKRFSVSFKRSVVQEIENGILTQASASRKYKIDGHSTISKWLLKYSLYNHLGIGKNKTLKSSKTPIELIEENKDLRNQIKALQTKVICHETMLELAEEHYGEPIRKNFYAKRLKK